MEWKLPRQMCMVMVISSGLASSALLIILCSHAVQVRRTLGKLEVVNKRMVFVPSDALCDGRASHQGVQAEQIHGVSSEFHAV